MQKKNRFDEQNETIKFCIIMLCKKKKNFTLKYYAKKKNCLDESNEMFKGTNFILEYYAKKEKNRLDESNEKKKLFRK